MYKYIALLAFTLILSACAVENELRHETAKRLASPSWMVERVIEADPLAITAFERMHKRQEVATIYIEGNGRAHITDQEFFDPTPTNPLGLHLASRDKSTNLAYLAQPYQYTTPHDLIQICDAACWRAEQYSDKTLNAYTKALDGIKARYGITAFHIVGYDGGATLAAMLAGTRADVLSLRTVSAHFDMNALQTSLTKLGTLPQHHFTGALDITSSPSEVQTYLNAVGENPCVAHSVIADATHDDGWVEVWPGLLKTQTPKCVLPSAPRPDFTLIEKPTPIYVPRMSGSKK